MGGSRRTRTDELVSVRKASEIAGVSPATVYRWIRSGTLNATNGPRGRLVHIVDAQRMANYAQHRLCPANASTEHPMHVRALETERDELRDRMQALEDERDTLRLRLGAIASEVPSRTAALDIPVVSGRWWSRLWGRGRYRVTEPLAVDGSRLDAR